MTRKIYAPVWQGLQRSLIDIFEKGFHADKVIQRQFKANRRWGSHDRKIFAESLYDIVRWWRKLLFLVDVEWPQSDKWSRAEYEVYDAVLQAWCMLNEVEMDPAIEKLDLSLKGLIAKSEELKGQIVLRESIPDWLNKWGKQGLGERWEELLPILNSAAPVYLRANRLKISPKELLQELLAENVDARLVSEDALVLNKRANLFLTPSFRAGHFELQDVHSQKIAEIVDPQPGERVIDACAGAGGKSLHLAARMQNKGKVIAMDIVLKKLEQLRERATRAGANCIETREIESTKMIKRLHGSADRVLLDVPCSGLGVFRRNPDAKWKLTREEVDRLNGIQREILSSYSAMVKPGGTLVYATCSIHPSENESQIEAFMSQSEASGVKRWELERQETLWPSLDGPDGFFYARFKRLS